MNGRQQLTTPEVDLVRTFVLRRAGLSLAPDKVYLIDSRLTALAHSLGLEGPRELILRLQHRPDPDLERLVVEAMVTHETTFFRDAHPFQALKEQVLPQLLRQRAATKTLDIWCAACATGQEPYSIAMVLQEHFAYLWGDWRVKVLATDVSSAALQRAAEGVYSQLEVNRGLPAVYLARYFQQGSSGHWQLSEKIRRWVTFQPLNLISPWPPMPAFDVIFLRNVLIYFDHATKQALLQKVRRTLSPDGVLFLGGAETTHMTDGAFRTLTHGRSVFFRP